ncbi:hypothetical protein ABES02_05875 [Neobacillus pocheonensis]
MEQENTFTKLKNYARKLKQNLFVLYHTGIIEYLGTQNWLLFV